MNNLVFEDKDVVSMQEVLLAQEKLEIEAATTGIQKCTYSRGYYIPGLDQALNHGIDQPIYSCRTCAQRTGKPVGVCEPCMMQCHTDHDVIECGLKRLFRCDCVTVHQTSSSSLSSSSSSSLSSSVSSSSSSTRSIQSTLPIHSCCAQPPIVPTEGLPCTLTNRYTNSTFDGKYCSCQQTYKSLEDTMIQCTVCDEWYHVEHLPGDYYNPALVTEATLICATCVMNKPYFNVFTDISSDTFCSSSYYENNGNGAKIKPSDSITSNAVQSTPFSQTGESDFGNEPFEIQPWYVCLTCSKGNDDGTGVCYACAQHCHRGHILSKPRMSEFYCDCEELLQKQAGDHTPSDTTHSTPANTNSLRSYCKLPKHTHIVPIPLHFDASSSSTTIGTLSPAVNPSSTISHDISSNVRSLSSSSTVVDTIISSESTTHTESELSTTTIPTEFLHLPNTMVEEKKVGIGQKRTCPSSADDNSENQPQQQQQQSNLSVPSEQNTPKHAKLDSSLPLSSSSLPAVVTSSVSTPFGSATINSSSSRYSGGKKYLRYGDAPLWCVRTGKRTTVPLNSTASINVTPTMKNPSVSIGKVCLILNEDIHDCLVPYLCSCTDCLQLYVRDKIISWFLTPMKTEETTTINQHSLTPGITNDTHENNRNINDHHPRTTVIAPDCRVWITEEEVEEDNYDSRRNTNRDYDNVNSVFLSGSTTVSLSSSSSSLTNSIPPTIVAPLPSISASPSSSTVGQGRSDSITLPIMTSSSSSKNNDSGSNTVVNTTKEEGLVSNLLHPSTTVVRPPGFRTLYEQGMDALTQLPLLQLANTTLAYVNMKDKLLQKLSIIVQEGRIVTEQDIRQFFEELKNERK